MGRRWHRATAAARNTRGPEHRRWSLGRALAGDGGGPTSRRSGQGTKRWRPASSVDVRGKAESASSGSAVREGSRRSCDPGSDLIGLAYLVKPRLADAEQPSLPGMGETWRRLTRRPPKARGLAGLVAAAASRAVIPAPMVGFRRSRGFSRRHSPAIGSATGKRSSWPPRGRPRVCATESRKADVALTPDRPGPFMLHTDMRRPRR